MSLDYVQSNTLYQAGSGNIIGATSVVLTSLTDIYGNVLTMSSFGAKGYITLEPDTTNEEGATFTGIVANANGTYTLTGVSTILAQSPYTETSGLVRQHSGGTKVVITDNVAFWATFGQTQNTNTWAAVQTFSVTPSSPVDPVNNTDVANKEYVDGVAVSGAPNANTTTKGIVQEATQAQVLSKTAAGSTGAELYVNPARMSSTLLSDYKVDTGSANAYAITPAPAITAYTVGQVFSFKAVHASTTASTLNVNALGTQAIKNVTGAALVANDILAGQIVVVEYDGTNFVMISPSGNLTAKTLQSATTIVDVSAATAPSNNQVLTATSSTTATWQPAQNVAIYKVGSNTSWAMNTASAAQTIAHGLGVTPKYIRLNLTVSGGAMSTGSYNGTTAVFTGLNPTSGAPATSPYVGSSISLNEGGASPHVQTGVVTFDATNITITWTLSGTNGTDTINIAWEAFA